MASGRVFGNMTVPRGCRAQRPSSLFEDACWGARGWLRRCGDRVSPGVAGGGARRTGLVRPRRAALETVNGELLNDNGDIAGEVRSNRAVLAAQAFVRLVETGGKGKARRADMVIVCDLEAYRRGHALDGEACHIVGGGPIPVSLAQELGRDAFLKAVLHSGTEINTIAHFGRKTSAVLRTALTLGAPPAFDGIKCSVPGCDRQRYLEQDHIDPADNGGLTALDNMQPLCWLHHLMKTERDRKAGRIRGRPSKQRKRGKQDQPARRTKQRRVTTGVDPPRTQAEAAS
jgi:hypothetical protein